MRQHVDRGLLQVDAGEVQRLETGARRACTSRCILGGLPSSTSIGMSTGLSPGAVVGHQQLALFGRHAHHRERAALALAEGAGTAPAIPARSPARSAPGFRCTRFPWAPCRDSSSGTARRSKRAPRPASLVSSGKAFDRPPAPTSWIARIGFAVALLPAVVDDFLRAPLDLGVAALHRIEVQFGRVGAGRHRAGGAAAHADAHARAAQLDQQRAGRELDLLRLRRRRCCRGRRRS